MPWAVLSLGFQPALDLSQTERDEYYYELYAFEDELERAREYLNELEEGGLACDDDD